MEGKIMQIHKSASSAVQTIILANGLYTYKLEGADGYLQQGKLELSR